MRAPADVVNDEITAGLRRFLVHYDSDVGDLAAEILGDEVAGTIVKRVGRERQRFTLTAEKDHEIRDAAMVNIRVGCLVVRARPFVWVQSEVTLHVLVNFFLKIDADGAVSANDLVGADASAGSNVAAGVRDADVGGVVTDDVMGALDGCCDEAIGECGLGAWCTGRDRGCKR